MTNLVMTSKEGSVYRGAELDTWVRRPEFIVSRLVAEGLLPKAAYVAVVELPASSKKRSALFNVKFPDLAKRQQAIADFIDQPNNAHISPVTGNETISLLSEMMAHAHVNKPELISTDAVLQGVCKAIAVPEVYKALTSGGAEGFTQLVRSIKEASNDEAF